MALGPVTNLAFANKLNIGVVGSFKHVFVAGGSHLYMGTAGYGTDFNFFYDPDAAFLLFKKYKNITICPIETAFDFRLTKNLISHLESQKSPIFKMFGETFADAFSKNPDLSLHLRSALFYLLIMNPKLVDNLDRYFVTVERKDKLTRGEIYVFRKLTLRMDIDFLRYFEGKHGDLVTILLGYNQEKLN